MNELSPAAIDEAEQTLGDGPVVMVNLLWFRETPDYPADFVDAKLSARTGYYEGYVGGFRAAAEQVGVVPELLYAGTQLHGLLAGPEDDWDEIAIVRYDSFADLRKILNSEIYAQAAKPHRLAVVANWRFFATRSQS
ncbi:hypothetical protein ABFT80_06880 [Mesorhizobium sp. SB112]|uniref:hypothetical protein n=1 Tax=Mesorhizobium sp. SB112 TaxID=3151853 RepID=UPI0032631FD7